MKNKRIFLEIMLKRNTWFYKNQHNNNTDFKLFLKINYLWNNIFQMFIVKDVLWLFLNSYRNAVSKFSVSCQNFKNYVHFVFDARVERFASFSLFSFFLSLSLNLPFILFYLIANAKAKYLCILQILMNNCKWFFANFHISNCIK